MIKSKSHQIPKYLFTLMVCLFISLGSLAQETKSLSKDSIQIEGNSRSFEYYIPKNVQKKPSLVFVLHGSGGTMTDARNQTNFEFESLAEDRKSAIIVYPQGYDKHWNDCRKNASYKANQEDVNDIEFFTQMIAFFVKQNQINTDAVFVTGISNGGHMCYKLAYEMPDDILGIAPFVANLPEDFNNDCQPKNKAMSVMVINGTEDPINPYGGGWVVIQQDSSRGSVMSTEKTIEYWKNLAICSDIPEVLGVDDYTTEDGSTVTHLKYKCKDDSKKIELLKIVGGGHVVPLKDTPALPERARNFIGRKNRDINAPMMVLDFFESLIE